MIYVFYSLPILQFLAEWFLFTTRLQHNHAAHFTLTNMLNQPLLDVRRFDFQTLFLEQWRHPGLGLDCRGEYFNNKETEVFVSGITGE